MRPVNLLLILTLLISSPTLAQIEHGGTPFNWEEKDADRFDIPSYITPALDMEAVRAADEVTDQYKSAPYRFGIEHEVALNTDNSGTWTTLDDGSQLWQLNVQCPDAKSMSFLFSTFKLTEGSELFIWNEDRTAFKGSYTKENNKTSGSLAVGVIYDDNVTIELIQPANVEKASQLELGMIVHGYRDVVRPSEQAWEDAERGPFGNSGACNININCPEGDMWQVEKRSVALIVQGGFAQCTGAMVNNTAQDGTPYFLTADHCLGNPNNWVFYFNHESSFCGGNTGPTNQSISGADLVASNGGSDFALCELSQTPPADFNVQYAGWDNSDAQTVTTTTGIHHPSGDLKKICHDFDEPSQTNQFGAAVWFIDEWEEGVTEGGSSGSPLFDQNHRVIGQLYGGYAACAGSQNNGEADWYGRFGVSWDGNSPNSRLRDWLDPLNTGATVLDGYPEGFEQLAIDMSVGGFEGVDDVICGNSVNALVNVTNVGTETITSMTIEVTVNGTVTDVLNWSGNLEPFASAPVLLGSVPLQDGNNTIGVTLIDPNGEEDENPTNNSGSISFSANTGPTLDYKLELTLDNYGSETTWTLRNDNNQVIYEGGPYGDDLEGTVVEVNFCIEDGCYVFEIEDSFGDGICCQYGEGSYELFNDLGQTFALGGEFSDDESVDFCTDALSVDNVTNFVQQIFPNPTNGELNIALSTSANLTLVDLTGRIALSKQMQAQGLTQLDVSSLTAGVYLLQVELNGAFETHKVIIE